MKILFCFFFFIPVICLGNIFTVTSNADNGNGSLRTAINNCAANGIIVKDTINFAISDTTRLGRTIDLQSQLPALTSNVVIDASGQSGSSFGTSDAKIILLNTQVVTSFSMLHFSDANDIEVYGLYLLNTYFAFTFPMPNIMGIDFMRCNNITIGKPAKGNFFRGFNYPIYSFSYIAADSGRNLVIQSNQIGLNEAGGLLSSGSSGQNVPSSYYALKLSNIYDILIGGHNSAEGNVIYGKYSEIRSNITTNKGFISVINNKFNLDINGNLDLGGSSGDPITLRVYGNSSLSTPSNYKFYYLNNKHNGSFQISGIKDSVIVQGSEIFVPSFFTAIEYNRVKIANCSGGGIIGGNLPGEKNEIFTDNNAFNYYYISTPERFAAISIISSPRVTISQNSVHCSAYYGSGIQANSNTYVRVDSTGLNFVRGKATPNCRIEIFEDDDCPACEGEVYLGATNSAADSTWSYTGTFNKVIVATATDTAGSTSMFSIPEWDYTNVKVTPASCGLNNGSITGLVTKGNSRVEWKYIKWNGLIPNVDSVYAHTNDIYNLAPGTYFFHAWLGNTCRGYPMNWTIDSLPTPKIDTTYRIITHPSCGLFNGSITNIYAGSNPQIKSYWKNSSGQIFRSLQNGSGVISLQNVSAGKYKLFVIDSLGGCVDSAGFFQLYNQSGPTLSTDNMVIQNATCGQSNGTITNIKIQNASGTPYIRWSDANGNFAGSNLDLQNLPAGNYYLKYKDNASCDTIVTPFYTIQSDGLITIDTSAVFISPSSCTVSTGSISNLFVTGATTFSWKEITANLVVSNTLALSGVPTGSYQMTASNSFGCTKKSPVFTVKQRQLLPIGITTLDSSDANCNLSNGYVKPAFTVDTTLFNFEWKNASTNTIISNYTSAYLLAANTYYLVATDTNHCSGELYRARLKQLGKPIFDYANVLILPDTCQLGVGEIKNLQVHGGGAIKEWIWKNGSTIISHNAFAVSNLPKGAYTVVVKDIYNCSDTSSNVVVDNINIVLPMPLAKNSYVLKNTAAQIIVSNYLPGKYLLFDNPISSIPLTVSGYSTLTTPTVAKDKIFYLRYDKGTCESSLSPVEVKVFYESTINLPNAFSPNGDGVNDVWKPVIQGIINISQWQVFNRYGQQVFSSTDFTKGWNGKQNNKYVPVGTYYWFLLASDNQNKSIQLNGSVTVIK